MTKAPAEGSGRPKRTRRQVAQEEPAASTVGVAPAVKRRRLNGPKPTSTAAPPAPAPVLPLTSNGDDTNGRRSARNKPVQKGSRDTTSVYDRLPGSSEDETREAPSAEVAPAIKYRKLGLRRPQPKPKPAPPQPESVYEVPDSDDELQAPKPAEESEDNKPQLSPSKKRVGNGLSKNLSQGDEGESRPKRRGRPPKIKAPIGASTARKEPVAARLAKSVIDTQREAPQLKGILTPQKNKVGRPKKNVAFDKDAAAKEREVYFEDLPSKSKSSGKPKKQAEIHIEEEQASDNGGNEDADSEDDEVCTICLKPDSEPPNEIIFCDNCNMAVHQECYDIPVIPEDDWICRNCSQEDVVSGSKPTPKPQEAIKVRSAGIPKIPNFEQHLHTMQRVLLDRCAGNRRIKLQGQSESYDKAFQLVEQTVLAGEGNSMMVIGARGCGKTTV